MFTVLTTDDWGGFYDHVVPPFVNDVNLFFELRGFRVPCLVVSPIARRGFVAGDVYDHTSILRMIEWRYDLEPLSLRDAGANNLADVLDFKIKPKHADEAPDYDGAPFVSQPCAPAVGLRSPGP